MSNVFAPSCRCRFGDRKLFRNPDCWRRGCCSLALEQQATWAEDFCRAVYRAEFAEGRRIDQQQTIRDILFELKVDPEKALAAAQTNATKDKLRAQTDEAQQRDIFGSPTFITPDGEMFWGNDRLESAIAWARRVG